MTAIGVAAAAIVAASFAPMGCREPGPVVYGTANSLLLITVDTLRSDYLGVYGHEPSVSPRIDELASRSLVFERTYATAPFTGPSHASILTSKHPSAHGVIYNGHRAPVTISDAYPTLAEHLRAQGFETAAIVSAGTLDAKYGFGRGFDTFELLRYSPHGDRGGDGSRLNETARRWLAARPPGARFFLWIHYFDPHMPYVSAPAVLEELGLPEDFRVELNSAKQQPLETLRSAYRAEVYEVDGYIGDLLRYLREADLEASTVVALTADHGEYLGEHGFIEHSQLYDEVLSVPLLIRPPALRDQVRRPQVASTIDLAPTVLEILEVEPLPGSQGRSLLAEPTEPRAAFAEWRHFRLLQEDAKPQPSDFQISAQLGSEKYLHDVLVPDASQLFDLSQDPEETRDLLATGRERTPRLRSAFENHLKEDLPNGILGVDEVEIDEESMQMLRSLGYVH